MNVSATSPLPRAARFGGVPRAIRNTLELARFGVDFFVLRRPRPFVLGLVTNDTCNLSCAHCRVANTHRYSMRFDEIRGHLERFYERGARFLYVEGGEPYLWRDGPHRLPDVVELARDVGYLRTHVYTNGTRPLDPAPDFTWVSIDGLRDTYRRLRGIDVERVVRNVSRFAGRFGIVFVVNTVNRHQIREFLEFVRSTWPGRQVMFYFHTPYYGVDHLLLSASQKRDAIETLLACKRVGLPVMNSRAGLRAVQSGRYAHPHDFTYVVDQTGDYPCCRAIGRPEVCDQCGYAAGAELALMRTLRPGPLLTMLRSL